MAEGAPLVLRLLEYIEQVEKLKIKPAFSVPEEYFVAYQQELRGLPELHLNLQSEGDDIWLRVPRLQEIPAPDPDETLRPWVTLPKSPEKAPELKSEVTAPDGRRDAAKLQLADHPNVRLLFDWYVENQWNPWAAAERPRRKTIARYNKLFALQQAIASEGAETPIELVWGIGYAAWRREGHATPVKHPLLTQSCEITLNAKTFDLEIRPRDVEPKLECDCYSELGVVGVRQLESFWKAAQQSGAHRINPFEASTFDGVLKAAVGHLDPTGAYEVRTDDVSPPSPSDKLKITNTWVLFARKRSGDIFLQDIQRLKAKVDEATSLPGVIRSLVQHGDDTIRVRPEQPFRGLSSSDSIPGAFELYFPMPYNDEQVSIVRKLESNDGVVVQGPPGTGKTHTIANVICHYLAQGKRVLVTAKGESALAVLQEKLPEHIRPLSVSLLSDERDGKKQFEHAIQTIASRVTALNPSRTEAVIEAAEQRLNQLHAKIASVDRAISDYAGKHMRSYVFQGKEVMPEDMAKYVMEHAAIHEWFDDDIDTAGESGLPFDGAEVSALRQARMRVGGDLAYLEHTLPATDNFPGWPDLAALHRDIVKARAIDAGVSEGNVLALIDSTFETFERARVLEDFLVERAAIKGRVVAANQPWLSAFITRIRDLQPTDLLLQSLLSVSTQVRRLEEQRRELLAKAVDVPPDAELSEDYSEAITRLVAGKSAFALPFGRGDARKLIAGSTVLGAAPTTADDWRIVERVLVWRREVRQSLAGWNAMAGEFGLEPTPGGLDAGFKQVSSCQIYLDDARSLTFDFDAKLHGRFVEVFGKQVADAMWDGGETFVDSAFASLQAHVDKGRLAYAMKRVAELAHKLNDHSGPIVEQIRAFLVQSLGSEVADEVNLQGHWLSLQMELSRLTDLRREFDEIANVADKIEAAGAPGWAKRLRTQPASDEADPQVPPSWLDAWNWRKAALFLQRIDGHHRLRELFQERKTLTISLERTYQELVAEKTWLGVFKNSPDSVRQALQAYLNAVQAMGAGTGVRAVRHRRTARDAMLRAYKAVPCWVLPQWRVSETVPAELGLFDLVVIDEASQSDIWALPALLRGKKLLVVGDHKQVSPSAVGMAEERIRDLSHRFLAEQPHGAEMAPDKSIYDLARVVFAGNSVMLKEHFRSVPAIIEFSNREFYQGDIKPLRLPKANERLDPPLVDVFVKGGARKGDVNPAEAKAVVDEIELILADPQLSGRSIGVVTLLGVAQAARIHELVSERISPIDVVERQIAIGPPPVFQGRERDIMLVSMVLGSGDRAAANRADMHQRFNVAMSRARDRMYLFRSVADTDFRDDTLNGRVIQHFKQPFRQDARRVDALRERCESGFEREMFDELVKRGYRVEPQVRCGDYRIDFVVEGNEGRRLAIECDGDRYHGPGQWSDDMVRQRVLERAGWTFWRCFASSFVRRRPEVISDLMQTLEKLGIEPVGAESVDNTVWVASKEVDPLGIEAMEEAG